MKTCPEKEANKAQVYTQLCDIEVKTSEDENEFCYIYHQNLLGLNWKTCLLINSESSIDIFNNPKLLTEIHQVKKPLKLHCYAGNIQVTQKGRFDRIEVWYHPKGIANILSLKTLKKRHHVTYDRNDVFKVHTGQGIVELLPMKANYTILTSRIMNRQE